MWKIFVSAILIFAFVAGPWFLLRPPRRRGDGHNPYTGPDNGGGDSHHDGGHGGGGHDGGGH
jgi:hypothetical protein